MLWDPIRYLETCPSSDGACAIVLCADEETAKEHSEPAGLGAWHRSAQRADDGCRPRRRQPACRSRLRQGRLRAGRHHRPAPASIDCAEIYVPFSWYEADVDGEPRASLKKAPAGRWSTTAATAMTGDMPINPSGGVLSSNPIGASGMCRFAEAAQQVRGLAGEHQVDGAKTCSRSRVRRRRAVLCNVGRGKRASPNDMTLSEQASRARWRSSPVAARGMGAATVRRLHDRRGRQSLWRLTFSMTKAMTLADELGERCDGSCITT